MSAGEPPTAAADSGAAEVYRALLLAQRSRALSMLDREALSPTAGSFDRTFWAWKFVDFPRSRFQEGVTYLSFLYARAFEGNALQGNPKLLAWIARGLEFWCELQHGDGSFDEAYPFERSLAATAFGSFYVSEALGFLGDALDADVRQRVIATLGRAGDWLCANDESHGLLSNHLAAAAAACCHVGRLTGEARYESRMRHFLGRIARHQSSEGWYEEYGGADPGYQTHGSFYLARIQELTGDEELLASLERSLDYLACCIGPDGTLGGETASRNTQTWYPAAAEMLAPRLGNAAWLAERMRPAVASGSAAGLLGVDTYNYYPMLNNLVFAWLAAEGARSDAQRAEAREPRAEERVSWFPEAGLLRVRTERYHAFVGTAKGGVLKVFDARAGTLLWSDCGWLAELEGGRLASSQYLDRERPTTWSGDELTVEGSFFEMSRPTMKPGRFALFRLFTISVGRLPFLARWLKNLLVRVLITKKTPLDVRFQRTLRFGEDSVELEDQLSGPGAARMRSLGWEENLTTIHMGSARYFIPQETLATPTLTDEAGRAAARRLDPAKVLSGARVQRRLQLG